MKCFIFDSTIEEGNICNLSRFTVSEQRVICAIARNEPVKQSQGKVFVQGVKLTAPGVREIIIIFENEAAIYREEEGYKLSDPLLKLHIVRFRL